MDRRPAQLSGGQRQRVAMGRAIVRNPDVFLFDEPLSNLDAKLRGADARRDQEAACQQVQTTVIYVTHDQVEAMTLADRIVIMRDGHIEQVGTPDEVFERPANRFVAGFIGSPPMNLHEATVDDGKLVFAERRQLPLPAQFAAMSTDGRQGRVRLPARRALSHRPWHAFRRRRRRCMQIELPVVDHRAARQRDARLRRIRRHGSGCRACSIPRAAARRASGSTFSFDLSQAHLFATDNRQDAGGG